MAGDSVNPQPSFSTCNSGTWLKAMRIGAAPRLLWAPPKYRVLGP